MPETWERPLPEWGHCPFPSAWILCGKMGKHMATYRKDPSGNISKTIHCRLTAEEHAAIVAKADAAGLSITKYVVRALLAAE